MALINRIMAIGSCLLDLDRAYWIVPLRACVFVFAHPPDGDAPVVQARKGLGPQNNQVLIKTISPQNC